MPGVRSESKPDAASVISLLKVPPVSTEGLRIGFERSGGYTGIPMTADVRTKDLPPDQARELERLVEQAGLDRFADSSAGPGQPDRFTYHLRVERDGGEHEVWLGESDLDERTRPLVEWLSAATRPPGHTKKRDG